MARDLGLRLLEEVVELEMALRRREMGDRWEAVAATLLGAVEQAALSAGVAAAVHARRLSSPARVGAVEEGIRSSSGPVRAEADSRAPRRFLSRRRR